MQAVTLLTAMALLVNSLASIASTDLVVVRIGYGIAALISLAAILIQLILSQPFVIEIAPEDWAIRSDEIALFEIPARNHKKGRNAVARFETKGDDGCFAEAVAGLTVDADGNVIIDILPPATRRHARVTVS